MFNAVGDALNIYNGLASHSTIGKIGAVTSGADMFNNLYGANNGMKIPGVGPLSEVMGIYSGLKQGGVAGYGGAAINAAGLYGNISGALGGTGLGSMADFIGPAGAVLGVYNFAKNWQSGATGADALGGMGAGAGIGTMILPGIGTLVGAGIGLAVGAVSSAFGGGKKDVETQQWNNFAASYNKMTPQQQSQAISSMSPQQAFQNLAGVMDAKNNSAGHSEQIEQVFGRMGESNMMSQMTTQINAQIKAGKIAKNANPQQIYNQVVVPWLKSKGATIDPNSKTSKGAKEGQALIGDIQSLIGAWQKGALTSKTKVGIKGQTIAGLAAYGG